MRIKLTQFGTGQPILINDDQIMVVQRLPAITTHVNGAKEIIVARTRIDLPYNNSVLVDETVEQIDAILNPPKDGD